MLTAKLQQSAAALAAMHEALIQAQENAVGALGAEREKLETERMVVARCTREADGLRAEVARLRAAPPRSDEAEAHDAALAESAHSTAAEGRAAAAVRELEDERHARVTAESRAAEAGAQAQQMAAQMQEIQATFASAEAAWENQRVAGAIAIASALSEVERWEAEARQQAELRGAAERQFERDTETLLDELEATEEGYREVVGKQRRARKRAEKRADSAHDSLAAAREPPLEEPAAAAAAEPSAVAAQTSGFMSMAHAFPGSGFDDTSIGRNTSLGRMLAAQATTIEQMTSPTGRHSMSAELGSVPFGASPMPRGALPTLSAAERSPVDYTNTSRLQARLRQLVTDDEVAAARSRIAARDTVPGDHMISRAASAAADSAVTPSLHESGVGPVERGPSTAELSSAKDRLHDRMNPLDAVAKVLEEVDASRSELARLAKQDKNVNELLRSAVPGGGGRGAKAKYGSPPRRRAPKPDFAASRRLASGRSEWSSDSSDEEEEQAPGSRRARNRSIVKSDPWTEATSPDDGQHVESSYRDPSLSRRIESASAGWQIDDGSPSPRQEQQQRGGGGGGGGGRAGRQTERSMYEPPAATGSSRW